MDLNLETVLAVVISLITLNLLFIGFYIVSVLREVKKTVQKAGGVIDEVDRTVKDGVEKVTAMERPLAALAATTAAFGGVIRTASAIRSATQSILNSPEVDIVDGDEKVEKKVKAKKSVIKKPKFFRKKEKVG